MYIFILLFTELIKLQDNRYEVYENLLISRESVRKEAHSIEVAYIGEFGDFLVESLKWKIECIKLQKQIDYCHASLSQLQPINLTLNYIKIEHEMASFDKELNELHDKTVIAKAVKPVTDEYVKTLKSTYRRIAKNIHPYINPKTDEVEELLELWRRTTAAYRANNLEELEDVEVQIDATMKSLGDDMIEVHIENIDEKIRALDEEINEIKTSKAYTLREFLEDETKSKNEHARLSEDIYEQMLYAKSLEKMFAEILDDFGVLEGDGTYS